ncbi:MAG: transglutaminaseTgpA domain-containing protein [Luteimonas sp.]
MPTGAAPDAVTQRIALDAQARLWALMATAGCMLPLLLQLRPMTATVIAAAGVAAGATSMRGRVPSAFKLLVAALLVGYVLFASRFALGRDTGCAMLAAMLALKPLELHTLRDARSLLGFALFAPFATFLLDQGPLSLLLGLAGTVLVLMALLRLTDLQTGDLAQTASPFSRFASVMRLIAIGLPLALTAFWLFPRIATPLWGAPERALARPGLSDRMSPGEWIDFLTDDSPAARVKFFGATPATAQMYWRGPVLWNFDGRTWTQPRWFRHLPAAAVAPSAQVWDYQIEIEPTDRRQLVALDLPLSAPDGSRLSLDYGLFVDRPLGALTRWRMRSSPPAAFEPQLKTVLRQAALRLPDGFNPRTAALARQWRREAGGNDAAIVNRFLAWVRRDFAYTLDTPLLGRHSVDEFLFEQKAGFCEHFSASFVVTMRAAGIPARVVTGYVGGYRNRYGDYWLVRRSDAHAWAEVWLAARGWVRVDPTAAVAPERIYDTLADRAPGNFGAFAGLSPVIDMGDFLRRGWNDFVLGFDASRQQRILQPFGIDEIDDNQLVALFCAIAGLALAWMLWLTTRSERERDPLLRAWHRLDARYRRLGLSRAPHETANNWAARIAAAKPQSALPALSARFVAWRYAHHRERTQGGSALKRLIGDLRRHRP